ncbi:hypothetical protein MO973_12580 [Paenibacillus sp. TRM 82003]|nr:hypothetical protein [Paenibacillus sp. TRM 82003]
MEISEKYVSQYVELHAQTFAQFQERVLTRVDQYGAYRFLRHKSPEEIVGYGRKEFQDIFRSLYSTQRLRVYNDLESILTTDSGCSYFRGFINRIIRRSFVDIDELHLGERAQIKNYSKLTGNWRLGFGKNTMSQIAHFCKPDKYPLSNTKSQAVIFEFFEMDVRDNYYEFTKQADVIVDRIRARVEEVLHMDLEIVFRDYKYVLLDDFIDYAYEIIKQ